MIVTDTPLLDQLTAEARNSPRLRMNRNFHPTDASHCHRLLNAIEPASYIRPHRHLDDEKDEAFVLVRGRLGVIEFDDEGRVTATALLVAGSDTCIATIPHGVFHTAVSLQPGSIFFEAKAGPYLPFTESEKASWAPEDNTSGVAAYLQSLCALFPSP